MKKVRRGLCLVLTLCMFILTITMSGCGAKKVKQRVSKKEKLVTLNVNWPYSSFSGLQQGWMAQTLLKKFNVVLNISNGYNNPPKKWDVTNADIIICPNEKEEYANLVKKGFLYNWNKENLLSKYGLYINKNLQPDLQKNKAINASILKKWEYVYGIGENSTCKDTDHEDFFYNWDIRWDLYEKLGRPVVNNLQDYEKLLVDMKQLYSKNVKGKETYGVSLWSDWDEKEIKTIRLS